MPKIKTGERVFWPTKMQRNPQKVLEQKKKMWDNRTGNAYWAWAGSACRDGSVHQRGLCAKKRNEGFKKAYLGFLGFCILISGKTVKKVVFLGQSLDKKKKDGYIVVNSIIIKKRVGLSGR